MNEFMTAEQALSLLNVRIGEATEKHPEYARGAFEAFEVIEDEVRELRQAVACESRKRQIDEALDVAATCIRFIMGEHLNAR